MVTGVEAIIVAAIAAVGGVVTALVQKSRKENRDDHNVVAGLVSGVKDELFNLHHKIDKVDDQMQDHMMWHYEKSDPTASKNKTRARKPSGQEEA